MKREDITKRAINIRRIRLEREKAIFMKLGSKIKAYFFTGILVTAPVSMTFYLAYKLISWIDVSVNRRNFAPTTICRTAFRGSVWFCLLSP